MHLNSELVDDVIKLIIIGTSSAAAFFGAKNHQKVKHIDEAVNGSNPGEQTLRENVQDLHDRSTPKE